MRLSIISACYGSYDRIKPPVEQDGIDVSWTLITDEPGIDAPGWNVIVERRPHLHPNVAAKIPKFRPDLYVDYPSVWVDASSLLQRSFAQTVMTKLEHSMGWTMFPHPQRLRITDEVVASRGLPKYDEMDLEAQVSHYIKLGYPNGHSLWATGVIGRDGRDNELNTALGNEWLLEVTRWSFQDQLSFPYLLWKYGFQPTPLAPDLYANSIVWFDNHGR